MKGVQVRKPEHLNDLGALIIPGGESTTMAKLAEYHNLVRTAATHSPTVGCRTCLIARQVLPRALPLLLFRFFSPVFSFLPSVCGRRDPLPLRPFLNARYVFHNRGPS